ncbi:MAG: helix-turn-helix transcriptional regulator [Isosphaeraceae bacterium]
MVDDETHEAAGGSSWTFLSNHGYVLLCLAREPGLRLRELAQRVGITERAVQRIIADLEQGGYISRAREGRRNRYEVHSHRRFRHPMVSHREVRALLDLLSSGLRGEPAAAVDAEVPEMG